MKFIYTEALLNLVPNAQFSWQGEEWEGLKWLDSRPCPTKQEWLSEIERLKISLPIRERQEKIKNLLDKSDYIELPSFIKRKGESVYQQWISYRDLLRMAYHDQNIPIPEKPVE